MKLDLATFPTVPDDPPAAGPDRALEPCPPGPRCPGELLEATDWAAPAEGDVLRPMNNPVTDPTIAPATISPRLKCESDRRTLGRSADPAMVAEVATRTQMQAEGTMQ